MSELPSLATATIVALCVATSTLGYLHYIEKKERENSQNSFQAQVLTDVTKLIGNTPLIEIRSLSEATGCRILGKCEFLNPGGSIKDRVALQMITEAQEAGLLEKGDTVYEGTAGSTGVSLAMISRALGYKCHIFMPDDQAIEKSELLDKYGARVDRVRPVSIVNRRNFVNLARKQAELHCAAHENGDKSQFEGKGFYCNQFENLSNFRAHYFHTGQEICDQLDHVDAFVCAAGTGGTIGGISRRLKECYEAVKIYLIDPPGSSLFKKVNFGVVYTAEEAEGFRLQNPYDTITEGIGINRLTNNFAEAIVDKAYKGTDIEAVEMGHFLLYNDGIFVGSSSAMNCVGAVKVARELGPGHTIVTVLCDGGQRSTSKFYNPEYLEKYNLTPVSQNDTSLTFVLR